MAFVPAITTALSNSGKTLTVTDSTGVYSATNTKGWNSPVTGVSITAATLTITYSDGGSEEINVLSQIPDTVSGSFSFTSIDLSSYKDGITTISYKLNVGTTVYKTEITQLYTCTIRNCIDKMWVKVACDTCHGNCDLVNLIDDANLAEGLYRALVSGASCCSDTCVTKILTALNNLCSWKNCNC
tara:strand:+ start:5532 stop:6086 length:555 start_codon:yes stop_codon:yes gene_type:complete